MPVGKQIRCGDRPLGIIISLILLFGISTLSLQGCLAVNRLHLIVPEQYQGFLVIRFQCPNGTMVHRQLGTTTIAFSANGTACLTESYEAVITGTWMIENIQNESGTMTVPWVTDLRSAQGWGLVGGSTSSVLDAHGQVRARFAEYWIGDMAYLRDITSDQRFTEWEADFFAERFGLQRDGSFVDPLITPTP